LTIFAPGGADASCPGTVPRNREVLMHLASARSVTRTHRDNASRGQLEDRFANC
jgi:hypothetical protein